MQLAPTLAAGQRQGEKPDLPNLAPNKLSQATTSRTYFATDRLIVRFRAGKSLSGRAAVHRFARGRTERSFRTLPDIEVVQLEPGLTLSEALRRYRSQADVLYAEPDYRRTLFDLVPNDPMFTGLWGLRNTGQSGGLAGADIDAVKAWDLSTGSSDVVVGTIDTGVDWNHPDLAANIYRNDPDCNNNGIDDDGNGFVDDCHGFNAVAGSGDPIDTYAHGTHVAGTIGAVGNNALGVVGVNWKAKILACKTDDGYGYLYDSAILLCLDYMATMKDRGVNIIATNNSYGGVFENKAVTDAIREQMNRGILFIAAAANAGLDNDTFPVYPANTELPNVIAVAATNRFDGLASFSDYGRHTVHLGAPGVAITSTVPGGGYDTWDGTSMATPHVVGSAALLKAYDPALDWAAIKNRILAGGDTIASLTATIAGRRLNVYGAMTCANQDVTARLIPRKDNVYAAVGEPVMFSMLHIICANPAGEPSVNVGDDTVALRDDGASGDEAAGDGVYTGTWIPAKVGHYSATFPNGDVITVHVLKPYTFSTTDYQWRTIAGTSLNLYDEETATVIPPFPVRFGGLSFPSIAVDANGVIRMLAANEPQPWGQWGVPRVAFPLPTEWVSNAVAPLWTDLFEFPGNVFWEVIGDAPNRELVIEWRNVKHYLEYGDPGGFSPVTFEVVFFENSDDVLFNYADTVFDNEWYDYGNSASIGVQVSQGVAMQFSCFAPAVLPGTAVRWQTADSMPTSIEILWPNGGEIWRPGETHNITWNATGPAATDFRIELLKGDALDSILAASVPASAGSYSVIMPLGQARGADYKVRLVSNTDAGVSHSSAGDFIIDDMHMLEVLAGYAYWAGGQVVSSPAGIDCHFICHAPFATGTVVTLTATADPGTTFTGWVGACTGTGSCVVTLSQDLWVFAGLEPSLPDFSFAAPPLPQTVTAGQSARFTIGISGNNGFTGTVSFACTAGVPRQASCSFSPPTVTVGASPVTTTLTITTTARSMALLQAPLLRDYHPLLALCLPLIGFVLAPVVGRRRLARQWHVAVVSPLLLLLLLTALAGCGGGTSPPPPATGTPAGTYSVTVTATSGSLSHTQTVTLVVN